VDPYVVLGVDPAASPDEIDDAYARRQRLHDPTNQGSDADRSAAQRFQTELAEAYRALLGTSPPKAANAEVRATDFRNGRSPDQPGPDHPGPDQGGKAVRPVKQGSSPGRGILVVIGTLLGVWVVIQVPVALGFGFLGLIIGFLGSLALVALVLAREHGRST
jgi:hypothetical protein